MSRKPLDRALDYILPWAFTPQGFAFISLIGAAIMTGLAAFTKELAVFAPLSYGIVFLVSIAVIASLLKFIEFLTRTKLHAIPTFLKFSYDGKSVYQLERKNIYGWRGIPLGSVIDSNTKRQKATSWIFSACFMKPISTDTILISYLGASEEKKIPLEMINFDPRYANLQIHLEDHGIYRIEYKFHSTDK
jgi:hypothetical protein